VSDDKRVTGRSDAEVRRIAERTKAEYSAFGQRPVDILTILKSGSVPTIFGRKKLVFLVVDDAKLGRADGRTEYSKAVVTITVKRCVHDEAIRGEVRARMTLAHELAHAVMHHSAPFLRVVGAAGIADDTIPPYQSAEHQAKVFAAAFLIHEDEAMKIVASALRAYRNEETAKTHATRDISIEFRVSQAAAEVAFDRLVEKIERQESAARVRKIADQTIAAIRNKTAIARQPSFLDHPCINCTLRTLVPEGTKVRCTSCGYFGDPFQDGDQLA
jgi:Zn-dependent peptidase ImmA (M78 family)